MDSSLSGLQRVGCRVQNVGFPSVFSHPFSGEPRIFGGSDG